MIVSEIEKFKYWNSELLLFSIGKDKRKNIFTVHSPAQKIFTVNEGYVLEKSNELWNSSARSEVLIEKFRKGNKNHT
jgi:hypothetical protein